MPSGITKVLARVPGTPAISNVRFIDHAGTPGEVVISNLVNRATVLLNYRLGDRVAVASDPCACGRTLPVLASLDGRSEDLLVRADGERVHESLVLRRLYGVPGLSNVEVVQLEFSPVTVTSVVNVCDDSLAVAGPAAIPVMKFKTV